MDRLPSDLDAEACEDGFSSAIPMHGGGEFDRALSDAGSTGLPGALARLAELESRYDPADRALYSWIKPAGRPSFTPSLLGDIEAWQAAIAAHYGPTTGRPLDFLVLGSRVPGVWCYGGDLALFQQLIRSGDRAGLIDYGHRCVHILHRNYHALDLPMLTIGLVQGEALGGGFEALLSFDVIIAERGSRFALPEVMFGLFPGMGAHAMLSRKLGTAMADRVILSNQVYTADDMYAMGIVAQVVEPGEGIAAVRDYMASTRRRHGGLVAARRAMRVASPVQLAELRAIVDLWADAALGLSEADLKLMSRLASTQARNYSAAAA